MNRIAPPHWTNLRVQKRESNIELFRIVVMFLIIAHHYVLKSGILEAISSDNFSVNNLFYYSIGVWGKTGVNCFVLITGYFTYKTSVRKFIKLVVQVLTYSIGIYLLFLITAYEKFSIVEFARAILPIKSIASNFTGCFLVFYLLIPFLIVLVENISQKHHTILICILLFAYTICGTAPFSVRINYVSWFSVLFVLASYIRKYGLHFNSPKFWGCLSGVFFLIGILSVYVCKELGIPPLYFLTDANKIIALLLSLSLFMFFVNVKIKKSMLINVIASTTFGVFLIHDNSAAMTKWLWIDTLHCMDYMNNSLAWIHLITSVLGVFAVCSLIDKMREYLVEKPIFVWLDKKVEWEKYNY